MGLWPFGGKSQSLKSSGLLVGSTDWHSHILPGVDDGVKDTEESLAILEEMEKLGVKHLWLTPHIMEDYPNETEYLRSRFNELKAAYKGNINLNLASENMIDALFEERLEENDFLPLGEKGNHLLVETSYYNPPLNMVRVLEQIKSKGYFPVLAHPERYRYMDDKDYKRLKEMGVLFQANYFSLVGGYGTTAQKKLEWLLKQNFIDLMGSDLHRLKVLNSLISKGASKSKHLTAMKAVAAKSNVL